MKLFSRRTPIVNTVSVSDSTMSLADDREAGAFGPVVREQKIKNLTKYPFSLQDMAVTLD